MLWNVLLLLFSPWYLLLSRLLWDDRDRQILLLHQQLLIAQRRAGKGFEGVVQSQRCPEAVKCGLRRLWHQSSLTERTMATEARVRRRRLGNSSLFMRIFRENAEIA